MIRYIPAVIVFIALCFCAVASLDAQTQDDIPYQIQRVSSAVWRVTATHSGPRLVRMPGEPPYTAVLMPGYSQRIAAGAPSLPVTFLPFALPPGGGLTVKVLSLDEEKLDASMAPFAGQDYHATIGNDWLEVVPVTIRDGLHSGGVRFSPVRLAAGGLRWAKAITFEIRINGITDTQTEMLTVADPTFINAEDAGRWQEALAHPTSVSGAVLREGEQYVVVKTSAARMYRITPQDLTAIGVNVPTIDPRTFRLFFEGNELPIRMTGEDDGSFEGDDVLEFFAERKQGDNGEYFDEWSDDNVYLLHWGNEVGRRNSTEDIAPSSWPQAETVTALPAFLHLEEDHEYHRGDFEYVDMQATERVPGEAWIWSYLLKKDSLLIPFVLSEPLAENAGIEFRVKGTSRDPSLLRLILNDVVVFEGRLGNYDTARVKIDLPDGILRNGDNTLVCKNVGLVECPPMDPACTIERIYVDWVELRYQRSCSLLEGTLDVDASHSVGPSLPARSLLRISAPFLRGVNIDTGDELTGMEYYGGEYAAAVNGMNRYHFFSVHPVTPSLELREYKNLADPGRQAEYIVLTHPDFAVQARRLADYRARQDGYTTLVVDVHDVYNEFNNGHKHPKAIKAFLRNAWFNWSEPRPRFVVFMGDASWDAKFRMPISTRTDFIPAYGNPVSDNYYVRFAERDFDPTPFIPIGRIPVEKPADADAVIDKIMEYEALPPQVHDNRFLFSVGGENAFEQDMQLKPVAETLIQNHVQPFCLEARRIYKRTLTMVSYDDLDTLIHEVNQGVSWFLFAGHGGTRVIDVGVERPDIFSNKGKYPFFATISCNTAHFAEPFETGLNERFVLAVDHGSIASFGTAGLGLIGHGHIMSKVMFRAMTDSAVRTYGELVHRGKLGLIAHYGPGDINTIHSVDQHCLLGDPATRIPLAQGAELLALPAEIQTDPDILTEEQKTVITTTVRNVGMCMSDSIDVRLRILAEGQERYSQTQRIAPFAVSTDLEWEYDFAGIEGDVSIELTVDSGNELTEMNKENNVAILRKPVLPRSVTQIFPLDNAVLNLADEVFFVLANPSYIPLTGNPALEVEVSSVVDFTTDVHRYSVPIGEVYTTLSATAPPFGTVLYWRARMVTVGASEPWSAIRSFRLEQPPAPDSWRQDTPAQLGTNVFVAMLKEADGSYRLGYRHLQLEVTSGGFNGPFRSAILRTGNVDVSPNKRGFNCAVVEPRFGDVVATGNFDTYLTTEETMRMLDFVRAVPDDHVLMLAVLDDANGWPPVSPNGSNILPELKAELKRFGSTMIDSVGYRDSYGFIGSRNSPDLAREMHFELGTVLLSDTLIVQAREGYFQTQRIGPANSVTSLGWYGELPQDSAKVDLTLIGRSAGGNDTVYASLSAIRPGENVELGELNCSNAPYLRVEGRLYDLSGNGSPIFRGLDLRFTSVFPEIGITSQVVQLDADSVVEGNTITIQVRIHNAGRSGTGPFDVQVRIPNGNSSPPTRVENIAPSSAADLELKLATAGLQGNHSYEVLLDPQHAIDEYYRANNAYSGGFISGRDSDAPELEVLFDGVAIVNNDYVRPKPEITIMLKDSSPLPVTDTTAMQLFLDGSRVWLLSNPDVRYSAPVTGDEKVKVIYTPELRDGLHTLSVSGKDATGNAADTIPYQVRFYVSSQARIDQILPWPSPTRGPMSFTFRCSGTETPEEAAIRIYTVAGRLIRRIDTDPGTLRVGFNRVEWDGRDQDGDMPANGVYFYKLSVTQQGNMSEYVGRFSVLR